MNKIKSIKKICRLIVGLCWFVQALTAQQVVTGRITDNVDGTPVVGASVFIANTTIGSASDLDGNYAFTVPGTGSFEIVVSHVSYQSVFYKVDTPKPVHRYDVALKESVLEEVSVIAAKTYKNRDVDLFWRTILGEKPSRNGMQVLNLEKVYFYLNSDNVLKVTCREPIEIINHQMGYHIRYVLQGFQYDYKSKIYEYYGMPSFEELTPQNSRQKELWEKKRQEVYEISSSRFMRALYRGQILEEGFLLVTKKVFLKGEKISPVLSNDILQTGEGIALLTVEEPLFLICYGMPVSNFMIQDSYRDVNAKDAVFPVMELLPQRITIFSDGTYSGTLKIQEHRNSIFGLSSKVPVEYGLTTQLASVKTNKESETNLFPAVEENITAQLEVYPQEKIHLHTDRDFYVSGEKIWFKAYVVDAYTHLFPTYSEYVYVELISPADTLISRVMIYQLDGMFYGHLPLADIPEGNYTLRAYTRYMENLGDDYFFKKNIHIAENRGSSESRGNVEMPRRGERLSPEQGSGGKNNYESKIGPSQLRITK